MTTTAVIEAAKKEVAVKVGWLKGSMLSKRHEREEAVSAAPYLVAVAAPLTPLGTYPKKFQKGPAFPVCRISESRNKTI